MSHYRFSYIICSTSSKYCHFVPSALDDSRMVVVSISMTNNNFTSFDSFEEEYVTLFLSTLLALNGVKSFSNGLPLI